MSLIVCPHSGCNRKYKNKRSLYKHLTGVHNVQDCDDYCAVLVFETAESKAEKRKLVETRKAETEKKRKLDQQAKEEAELAYVAESKEACLNELREKDALNQQKLQLEKEKLELEKQALQAHAEIIKRAKANPEECVICYERPSKGAVVVGCGHAYFCYECLLHWNENYHSRGCPYCRQPIQVVQQIIQ